MPKKLGDEALWIKKFQEELWKIFYHIKAFHQLASFVSSKKPSQLWVLSHEDKWKLIYQTQR